MKNKNFAFTRGLGLPTIKDGQTLEMFNFTQAIPHTEIFAGINGLIFRKCNLVNCVLPKDAKKEDCLHIQKEFCSNLHPRWVAKGIDECPSKNCAHLSKTVEDKEYDVKTGVLLKDEVVSIYKDSDA